MKESSSWKGVRRNSPNNGVRNPNMRERKAPRSGTLAVEKGEDGRRVLKGSYDGGDKKEGKKGGVLGGG